MTLNFLRWALAFCFLLPLAGPVLRREAGLWRYWRQYALLGLLGIGMYNALQYLALQSSTPINVTLVASGMPVWMMLTGWLFFGVPVSRRQVAGAVLSIAGVLLVLARGEWRHVLELRLVAGDLFMILATIAWSLYSWLLLRVKEPAGIRAHFETVAAAVPDLPMVMYNIPSRVIVNAPTDLLAELGQVDNIVAAEMLPPELVAIRVYDTSVGLFASKMRTKDGQLAFYNKRSQVIWRFREALDPVHGEGLALPPYLVEVG